MWAYTYSNELYHHGIKGQKWGVRRFESSNGHLTPAGKKRYIGKYDYPDQHSKNGSANTNHKNNSTSSKSSSSKSISKGSSVAKKILIGTAAVGVAAAAGYALSKSHTVKAVISRVKLTGLNGLKSSYSGPTRDGLGSIAWGEQKKPSNIKNAISKIKTDGLTGRKGRIREIDNLPVWKGGRKSYSDMLGDLHRSQDKQLSKKVNDYVSEIRKRKSKQLTESMKQLEDWRKEHPFGVDTSDFSEATMRMLRRYRDS